MSDLAVDAIKTGMLGTRETVETVVAALRKLPGIPLRIHGEHFEVDASKPLPMGTSEHGVGEGFSVTPPLSLYGTTKKCSEDLALEYASAFNMPVWINRCGVMAGAGQFGRADQGIVAYWIHSWRERRGLKYLGFGGHGHQVRDVLHPDDLAMLLIKQIECGDATSKPRLANVGGGMASAFSLAELSAWCQQHFGYDVPVQRSGDDRPFDLAWIVLDDRKIRSAWDWQPQKSREEVFAEVAQFAECNPEWMSISAP